jgi:hypothetical protein
VDAIVVLETLVEEVRTQIPVRQVVRELKNQIFSAITVKIRDIMHMNEKRNSVIITIKVKISHTMKTVPPVLCLWRVLKKCL